jgi:hypothetical protein
VPTLDALIDGLYKLPPDEFVSARTALAKSLSGDEAKRVKALTKPTIVPWSVNQVYWHARDTYSRLQKAGEKLRDAQLTALKGRESDVRGATIAHRQAVGEAVKAASRLAAVTGTNPDSEALARTFEALSLQQAPSEPHGRFTKPLQPQGFEALAGVAIKSAPVSLRAPVAREPTAAHAQERPAPSAAEARELRRREHEAAATAREQAAALKAAETKLSHAKSVEARARAEWESSKKALEDAERAVAELHIRKDR